MQVDGRMLIDLAIADAQGVKNDSIRIFHNLRNAAKIFSNKAFPSIVQIYEENTSRGLSFEINNNEVKAYNIAGRIMVTLSNAENSVSLVGADAVEHRAGLQSANGDSDEILDLLEFFTENWYQVVLKVNENITII